MSYAPRSPAGGHRTACSGSVTVMSSSAADQLRADLREAYDAGDIDQAEYFAELRKLRQAKAAAAAPQRGRRAIRVPEAKAAQR